MNEAQYKEICEACDRVLLIPDSTIERVAISWLHVIREHPMFLVNYTELFTQGRSIRRIFSHLWQILRKNLVWLKQLKGALRADGRFWWGKDMPAQTDILFVSHLLNASQAGQETDFYFGELPNELVARGHSALIVLINQSGLRSENFVNKWRGSVVSRVILADSLKLKDEFSFYQRLRKESLRLKILAAKQSAGLFQKVLVRASQEALSSSSQKVLRMERQLSTLVAQLKPKIVIVTHEGHAWERVIFSAARSATPRVRCIGYQHAALFRLQHAIRRNLASEYNPEHILTVGAVSKAQLERAPNLKGLPISILGSNRSFKNIRNDDIGILPQMRVENLEDFACLVLPEGIVTECNLLFEFSLACAKALPKLRFIWRLHPLVTYAALAKQNAKLRVLPSNVILSARTLEEDIEQSRWSLYRGTTAIVKAVGAGLHPIYLQLPGELTIDPLYELNVWRTHVSSVSEFEKSIYRDIDAWDNSLKLDLEFAQEYCESYFLPSSINALTALIPVD